MKDNEIISQIMQGGYSMEKCLETFYKENIRLVTVMAGKHQLDREALMDAYSDSIIDFKEQVRKQKFQQKSKCSTYFYSIFNNKCIDILRKNTTNIIIHEIPEHLKDTTPDIVHELTYADRKQYLETIINQLSPRCKEILLDWNDGYSMEEIARRNNLLNANVARSKRYSCLQQLMEIAGRNKSHAN